MIKKIFFLILITSSLLFAKEPVVITIGATYEFAEEDMISAIYNHIEKNKSTIEKRLEKERKKMKGVIKGFKPKNLTPVVTAREDRVFYPDMTYTLDMNIKDGDGRIMYPKGFTFNPLDYISLNVSYVIINGKSKEELEWFEKSEYHRNNNYMLLITDGNYYLLSKRLKQVVQFATKELLDKFKIVKTPSVIAQFNNRIQIREIGVKNEDNTTKDIE